MRKAFTLTELIISVILIGVVVLGVSSFHLASDAFLRSSETKVEVVNELSFVLQHLHKNIIQASGDLANPGIVRSNLGVGRIQLRLTHDTGFGTQDVVYVFDTGAHTITFDPGPGPAVTISDRFIELPGIAFDILVPATGGVEIVNLAFAFDANTFDPANYDERTNPIATTSDAGGNPTVFFFPWSHSYN